MRPQEVSQSWSKSYILHCGILNYNSNSNGWMFRNLKVYTGQSVLFFKDISFYFSAIIICYSINDKFSELTRRHIWKLVLKNSTALSGIACITLSFVDAHGRPLPVPAQDCAGLLRSENCSIPLHPDHFDELTTVSKVSSCNIGSSTGKHTSHDFSRTNFLVLPSHFIHTYKLPFWHHWMSH